MAEKTFNTTFLRTVALILLVVGAVGSLYFMFNASRNQKSIILTALFTCWILSPFLGLFLADKFAKRWTVKVRAFFYWLMIILTIVSLVGYSGALNTPTTKNAFVFLVIPFISWLLITISILSARRLSRKMHDNSLK